MRRYEIAATTARSPKPKGNPTRRSARVRRRAPDAGTKVPGSGAGKTGTTCGDGRLIDAPMLDTLSARPTATTLSCETKALSARYPRASDTDSVPSHLTSKGAGLERLRPPFRSFGETYEACRRRMLSVGPPHCRGSK